MNAVHQMALWFFLVQFLILLAALVTATRVGDPQYSFRRRKSFRGVLTPSRTGARDAFYACPFRYTKGACAFALSPRTTSPVCLPSRSRFPEPR
jgi:hypothetical protein